MKQKIALICALALALSCFLTGCGDNRTVLKIYNWEDYIDESVREVFKKEYPNNKINYDRFVKNEVR